MLKLLPPRLSALSTSTADDAFTSTATFCALFAASRMRALTGVLRPRCSRGGAASEQEYAGEAEGRSGCHVYCCSRWYGEGWLAPIPAAPEVGTGAAPAPTEAEAEVGVRADWEVGTGMEASRLRRAGGVEVDT